jgi:hypothetical protein
MIDGQPHHAQHAHEHQTEDRRGATFLSAAKLRDCALEIVAHCILLTVNGHARCPNSPIIIPNVTEIIRKIAQIAGNVGINAKGWRKHYSIVNNSMTT